MGESSNVQNLRPHRRVKRKRRHHSSKEIWQKILVITVSKRPQNIKRMIRLNREMKRLGLAYTKIEGPYAEKHCPTPPFNKRKFKHGHHQGAGILMKEFMVDGDLAPEDWEHHKFQKYHLHLFQAATMTGHIRAWKVASQYHLERPKDYFLILEDDATIPTLEDLRAAAAYGKEVNAEVIYLDSRNCLGESGVILPDRFQPGLAGYIVSAKAAYKLLRYIPVNTPVDLGLNTVAKSHHLKAFCPDPLPIIEFKEKGRKSSVKHACGV